MCSVGESEGEKENYLSFPSLGAVTYNTYLPAQFSTSAA